MKIKLIFVLFSSPLMVLAQQTFKPDTIITKDPLKPNTEYWIVHSVYGKVKAQGKMVNQKKEGVWREYNDNTGMPIKAEEYHNGEKEGASLRFSTNGVITADETYRNGKKEGQQMSISTSSRIESIENYREGLLDGNKKTFYEDGKTKEDGNWKNNQREGKTTWYFQTGKPSIDYTYKNGELNGLSTTYTDSGTVVSTGNYLNNDENGKWEFFGADGKAEKTVIYDKGKVIKEIPAKKELAGKKDATKKP